MTTKLKDPAIVAIFAEKGMPTRVAKACKLSRPAINGWKWVPEMHVDAVAEVLGWKPWQVRPDLFKPRRTKAKPSNGSK